MKKTVFRILSIVIMIIICFIVSFMIGLKIISNISESNTEEIEVIQKNEDTQNNNTQTSKTSSLEGIIINSDIEATKRNAFTGIITEVDIAKKQITVENPSHLVHHELYHADYEWRKNHKVIIDEKTYVKAGYLLCLDNVPMKEDNGNKIEIRDLKVGDTIHVSTINVEYTSKIIFEPLTPNNIVLIERKNNN